MWEKFSGIIIAAITGGGLTAIFQYYNNTRNSKRDDFTKIVETWTKDNERLRHERDQLESELNDLRSEFNKMRAELSELRSKIILMESAHSDAPLPMWLKDSNGRMLSVNKAYEETFLLPINKTAGDYIGNDDFSVWPSDVAAEFRKNDTNVLKTGLPWRGVEKIWNGEENEDWYILKYVRYAGNMKLGIAGVAIPMKWQNN